MTKFTIPLVKNTDGSSVIEAHSLNLSFNNGHNPGMGFNVVNAIDEGSIVVTGKQTFTLSNGELKETDLEAISVCISKIKEDATALPKGVEKTKLEARAAIWSEFLAVFQSALSIAITKEYILNK